MALQGGAGHSRSHRLPHIILSVLLILLLLSILWLWFRIRIISSEQSASNEPVSQGLSVSSSLLPGSQPIKLGESIVGPAGPVGPSGPPGALIQGSVLSVAGGDGLTNSGTATSVVLEIQDNNSNGLHITADVLTIGDSASNGLTLSRDVLRVSVGDGLGMSGDDVVAVAGDATIVVSEAGISVGTIPASSVSILDVGDYYSGTDVEAILGEIGATAADITEVTTAAGTGLIGGATSGAASPSLVPCGADEALRYVGGVWLCDSAVASVTDGSGLDLSGSALDPTFFINDNLSNGLVITADILTIADSGTNGLVLSGDVLTVSTGDGLGASGDDVVAVAADTSIVVTGSGITVGTILETDIFFSTGATGVSAVDIPILDAGAFFTGTNVEAALQEIGTIAADITEVNTAVGSGLTGGATSGAVNLSLIACGADEVLRYTGGVWVCDVGVRTVGASTGLVNGGTALNRTLSIDDSATNGLVFSGNVLSINSGAADGLSLTGDILGINSGAADGLGLSGDTLVINDNGSNGLEFNGDVLSLLTSCASQEVLKWDGASWVCAHPDQISSYVVGTISLAAAFGDVAFTNTVTGNDGIAAPAGGTDFTIVTSGTYAIDYRVNLTRDAGVAATDVVECRLTQDGASISGSAAAGKAVSTILNTQQEILSNVIVVELTASDVISLQCAGSGGASDNIEYLGTAEAVGDRASASITIKQLL
jgi:hypothetical protein